MKSRACLCSVLLATALGSGCVAVAQTSMVETMTIGETGEGQALQVHRVALPGEDALGRGPDQRPALLVVSGLHAGHGLGNALARHIADQMTAGHEELLSNTTLYVIHDVNADGAAFREGGGQPLTGFGGVVMARDADQDGRVGEDPGEDLNGDGWITWMRVLDPAPSTGLTAEWIVDPDDPRLLRKPDLLEGERARYALLVEGVDNDGDGLFNEDGLGGSAGSGTDLDKNFPALWPELTDGAGVFALDRPETRALVDWMLARDNIKAVLTFGLHDNLVEMPEVDKFDQSGRVPLGLEKDDKGWHEKISEEYKELTGFKNAEKVDSAGSFHQWAYAHFGVYSFATPGWYRPDAEKKDDDEGGDGGGGGEKAEEDVAPETVQLGDVTITLSAEGVAEAFAAMQSMPEAEAAKMGQAMQALDPKVRARLMSFMRAGGDDEGGGPPSRRSSGGKGKKDAEADGKWLTYLDELRGGEGFSPWTAVEHPQLTGVEVGGLQPDVKWQPPQEEWQALMEPHLAFVVSLLEKLPQVRVEEPVAERVGPGLWKVRVSVRNDGLLPTNSVIGVKTRRIPSILAIIQVEDDNLVNGRKIQRWSSIEGSGTKVTAEWWIQAEDGSTVNVEVRSTAYGTRAFAVGLN